MITQLEAKTSSNEVKNQRDHHPIVAMTTPPPVVSPKFHMNKIVFPATQQHITRDSDENLTPITPTQLTSLRM